jgi:hypothetical protein
MIACTSGSMVSLAPQQGHGSTNAGLDMVSR